MHRLALLVIALAACSDDEPTPEPVPGAPQAIRALAFSNDAAVAIGGNSTFGLASLGHADGDTWTNAMGVALFGADAHLFGGGLRTLYALSDSTLYKLDDASAFSWSARTVPPSSADLTIFGADDNEVVYAFELAVDGTGGVFALPVGSQLWTEVPGGRPIGLGARSFVVEGEGRISWSDPARGIVRIDGGAQSVIVDCAPEELGACGVPLAGLGYADNGDLTFAVCPRTFRLKGADLQTIELPDAPTTCGAPSTAVDGTSLISAGGVLWRLGPKATSWSRIAPADAGFTYVLRDRSTAFSFGDGLEARGLFMLDL